MEYEISWLESNRVVLLVIAGDVDSSSLRAMVDDLNEFLEQGASPVFVITEVVGVKRFPADLTEFRQAVQKLGKLHTNMLTGEVSPVLSFIATIIAKLHSFDLKFARDRGEATRALIELDPSLKHLLEQV